MSRLNELGGDHLHTLVKVFILVIFVLSIGFYLNVSNDDKQELLYMEEQASPDSGSINNNLEDQSKVAQPQNGLSTLIGKNVAVLKETLGEPTRKEPSTYGYEWWIYNQNHETYLQVGVQEEKIVTIYAIGEKLDISPFVIGQSIEEIYTHVLVETEINLEIDGTSYRFELSEEDMNARPIVKMGEIFVQLYIDKFTGELSSVRFLDEKTLVYLRPYELVYRGTLLEVDPIEDSKWPVIEAGSRKQIFDLTNIIRARHQVPTLKWDEETALVAYGHSKDMFDSNSFSHTSKEFGDLKDRLETAEVSFQLAGENIAANYIDAPAAMAGWLNSKGHRESLLNKEFTHIGVGVYHKHYTQNFIQKTEE